MLYLVLSYSAVGHSSTLISQQYILNKIYLSRITCKWIFDWQKKDSKESNCAFLQELGFSLQHSGVLITTVNWTARGSNQSILKEINSEYSLKGLMLKLKLQHFGYLMGRTDCLENTNAGKDWRQEQKGMTEVEIVGWHHQHDGCEFE